MYSSVWNWVISCRVAGFARWRKRSQQLIFRLDISDTSSHNIKGEIAGYCERWKLKTHVNLHLLINTIVHDQTVRQPNSMRLHGMTSNVGIVSNVRVVEVRNPLLAARPVCGWGVDGHERGHSRRHFEQLESWPASGINRNL